MKEITLEDVLDFIKLSDKKTLIAINNAVFAQIFKGTREQEDLK